MSRTLHLFGTDWCAMMVPIQVIRWYRMQCYDGTDSCAIVVPIRRYCHDAKPTYKKFLGYSPGVAVINDMIVGIENRDGNTNVRFNQKETLERIFKRLEASEIYISRARMDCGSCSEKIVDLISATL